MIAYQLVCTNPASPVVAVSQGRVRCHNSQGTFVGQYPTAIATTAIDTSGADHEQAMTDISLYLAAVLMLWLTVYSAKKVINFFRVPHAD